MFTWFPMMMAAFIFVVLAGAYLYLMPIGFAQLSMVFSCLFFSLIVADVAVLRQRLARNMRQLEREDALL